MEDPVREISHVIHTLTQASPAEQRAAIEKYFTQDASFTHPFCRTDSFDGSRLLIEYIYRWYKIMSPEIDLHIDSVAYDEANLLLYVSLRQTFRIQFLPFHRTDASLTTVLSLTRYETMPPNHEHSDAVTGQPAVIKPQTVYYIKSQNDLYQTSEFVKFVLPWFRIGYLVVSAFQMVATLVCVLLTILFWPVTWIEENVWARNRKGSYLKVF